MAEASHKTAVRALFWLCQWTWGIIQTLAGAALFRGHLAVSRKAKRYLFHGAAVTEWEYGGSVSLGMFVFVSRRSAIPRGELLSHEYGHCIQSLMLGALYLPVIGLPSIIWAGFFREFRIRKGILYDSFYTEKWADLLGKKYGDF